METVMHGKWNMSVFFKWVVLYFSLMVTFGLAGCDISSENVATLIISTDKPTIQSDGSDSATITVVALDSSNAVVKGAIVDFDTSAGVMSSTNVVTDANGEATIRFTAGFDATNQTVTVTATSGAAPAASVLVDIVGSTVTITATRTNLVIGGTDTATLTIKATDSAGNGVLNAPVTISVDTSASTGTASLSSLSGNTDALGEWKVDVIAGTSPGTVSVQATALNTTATSDFTVESLTGSLLLISPNSGATALINTPETISVGVPTGITDVTLLSSLGTWAATGTNTRTWSRLSGPVTVSDTLTSTSVGIANIQVTDSDNSAVSDTIDLYFVTESVDANSTVAIQASPTTIAPSTQSIESSSLLEATVTGVGGGNVANAQVTFSLSNTTGSGEYVSPQVAYTDDTGVATAMLFAGTQSTSGSGLTVTATLDGAQTGVPVSASTDVIVGLAGSIMVGMSTTVTSVNYDTAYSLPVLVQVMDSAGDPVANTEVSISLWPESYALGYWACIPTPGISRETVIANEDLDKDTILDYLPVNEDLSGNGQLTPPSSAAGVAPLSVITDANGIGTFNIIYLKESAGFVYDALSVSTQVQGIETMAISRFWLPALGTDVAACLLGPSPFNSAWPMLDARADATTVNVGGSTTITVTLTSQDGTRLAGQEVNALILLRGTEGLTAPTLTASPQTTNASGVTTFTYVAGDQAGTDTIKFYYTSSGVELTDYVTMVAE